jgi:hypothetical protein
MVIELDSAGCTVTVVSGNPLPLDVDGIVVELAEVAATAS